MQFRTNATIIRFLVRHTRTVAKQTVLWLVTRQECDFLQSQTQTSKAQEPIDDLRLEMSESRKTQNTCKYILNLVSHMFLCYFSERPAAEKDENETYLWYRTLWVWEYTVCALMYLQKRIETYALKHSVGNKCGLQPLVEDEVLWQPPKMETTYLATICTHRQLNADE